jgi:hypothetical protein
MTSWRHKGPQAIVSERKYAREVLQMAAHRIIGPIMIPDDFRDRVAARENVYNLASYLVEYNLEYAVQPTSDGIYVEQRRLGL